MVIKCDDLLPKISDYLEDDLDPALKRAMEGHFAQCRHCKAVLEGAANVVALYGDENMFNLPASFHSRLHRRLADRVEGQRGSWRGWLVSVAATGPNRLLMGDVTQFAVADVTATSKVHDIELENYINLASSTLGRPIVSSVATAVGNNKSITVTAPVIK